MQYWAYTFTKNILCLLKFKFKQASCVLYSNLTDFFNVEV